jgi:anti-sigma factor RsiW
MTIDHPYEDIEAFALGGLEPDRQRAVLDHADACPTCAVLLADAMTGVSALAELEEPLAVSRPVPLVADARRSLPRRLAPSVWFAGAAAAACLALLLWNVQLRNEAIGVPAAPPVVALVHSHFIHHPLTGSVGTAKVIQAVDGHWVYVLADGLTPNARYDLWETRHGGAIKVGEFVTDRDGLAAQYFEQAPGAIEGFSVTGSDKTPTQDPQALRWP